MPDYLDVLTGGVENLQHLFVCHQFKEWLEIDALSQGIDYDCFLGARHLYDTKQGVVGRLAQEFGIDSDDRVLAEARAGRGEFRSGANQIHEQSMTLIGTAFCRKRRYVKGHAANSRLEIPPRMDWGAPLRPAIAMAALAVWLDGKRQIDDSGPAKRLQNALMRLRRLRVVREGRFVFIRL